MSWSKERIRFALALALFLAWIAILTTLAILSADRPTDRRASPPTPAASAQPEL
jgi:hypothetical protein